MKIIKSTFAVFLLVTAGAAHSAVVAEYNVSETDVIHVNVPVTIYSSGGSGYGTATLDDSGLVTMYLTDTTSIDWGATYIYTSTAITTLSGSFVGGVFTPASGSTLWTSCVDSGTQDACNMITTPTTGALFSAVGGMLTAAGGTLTSNLSQVSGIQNTYSTYVLTPAVPIPAAAWMFGSGLIGLTGLARKRKAA